MLMMFADSHGWWHQADRRTTCVRRTQHNHRLIPVLVTSYPKIKFLC